MEYLYFAISVVVLGAFILLYNKLKNTQDLLRNEKHCFKFYKASVHEREEQLRYQAAVEKERAALDFELAEKYLADINVFRAELNLPPRKMQRLYKVTY